MSSYSNVSDRNKAVQWGLCQLWIHIKCNSLDYLDYRYLQNSNKTWSCIEYCSTIFPFNSLSCKKNLTCVNKVGHTSEFLFGIYWWAWKISICKKNCWGGPIKNVRTLIFTTDPFRRGMRSNAHMPTHMQKCLDVW